MDLVGQRLSKEEKKKNVDQETKRYKGQCIRESTELVEDKFASVNEKQEFPAKKPKLHSLDEDMEYGKDVKPVSKFLSDQFKELIRAIEASHALETKSSFKKSRELQRLHWAINYDTKGSSSTRGKSKGRAL